jgi:hypothetical protein
MERLQAWVACNLVSGGKVSAASVLETFGPGFFLCTPHELARDLVVLRSITDQLSALEPSEPRLPGFAPGFASWHELVLGYHRQMVLHWFQHVYTPLLECRDANEAPGDQIDSKVLLPLLFPEPTDQDSIAPFLENRYFRGVRTHLGRESQLMAQHCNTAIYKRDGWTKTQIMQATGLGDSNFRNVVRAAKIKVSRRGAGSVARSYTPAEIEAMANALEKRIGPDGETREWRDADKTKDALRALLGQ